MGVIQELYFKLPHKDRSVLHIGFDNTDSTLGKCTTHLAFKITSYLLRETDAKLFDYPLLIRLNPNIPWKTRGNGAVCLRLATSHPELIIDYIRQVIESESDIANGANPGLVIYDDLIIPESVRSFSSAAFHDVLSLNEADKICNAEDIMCYKFGTGHGVIGALAAIGCLLEGDHTFEAISYRNEQNVGSLRALNKCNVKRMDIATFPRTFNNFDYRSGRILIAPHGPDPIFCGIRGEDPAIVTAALLMIRPLETLDGYVVFRTNQGTSMHLQERLYLSQLRPYMAGYVRAIISKTPKVIRGGHVLFEIGDLTSKTYPVAVYEPTGLGRIAAKLEVGDLVDIGFGVREEQDRHSSILNLEYLCVLALDSVTTSRNPICILCKKRMKSEGKGKGYQCEGCKFKTTEKYTIRVKRDLIPGIYLPEVRSHRHLTKPMRRFGKENSCPSLCGIFWSLYKDWFTDHEQVPIQVKQ